MNTAGGKQVVIYGSGFSLSLQTKMLAIGETLVVLTFNFSAENGVDSPHVVYFSAVFLGAVPISLNGFMGTKDTSRVQITEYSRMGANNNMAGVLTASVGTIVIAHLGKFLSPLKPTAAALIWAARRSTKVSVLILIATRAFRLFRENYSRALRHLNISFPKTWRKFTHNLTDRGRPLCFPNVHTSRPDDLTAASIVPKWRFSDQVKAWNITPRRLCIDASNSRQLST
ncbi:hypothetical protein N4R57_20970 [Rhodobacteraceae bacterium D3-12]|nr:hypothetical protein N4R57_20970 [Rhodobacteraceae bacterium D3-12]